MAKKMKSGGKGQSEIDAVRERRLARERPRDAVIAALRTRIAAKPGITLERLTASMNEWRRSRRASTPWTEHQVAVELDRELRSGMEKGLARQVAAMLRTPALLRAQPIESDAERQERLRRQREQREARERNRRRQAEQVKKRAFDAAARRAERFFAQAGIRASIGQRQASIDEITVAVMAERFLRARGVEGWIDQRVNEHLHGRLLHVALEQLVGLDGMRVLGSQRGVRVLADDETLARINATRVTIDGRELDGNFLTATAPWGEVRDALNAAHERHTKARKRAERRRSREDPPPRPAAEALTWLSPELLDSLPGELKRHALHASADLRTARNLVFAHIVELAFAGQTARFEPITAHGNGVHVPFAWTATGQTVQGRISLSSSRDPLPCAVTHRGDGDRTPRAWATALVAYASLTCREALVQGPGAIAPRGAGTGEPKPGTPARELDRNDDGTRHRPLGGLGLRPDGRTRGLLSAFVAGHRRRLTAPRTASDTARRNARLVGITLRPHETWVTPYVRGVPADAVLRFDWTAPTVLTAVV